MLKLKQNKFFRNSFRDITIAETFFSLVWYCIPGICCDGVVLAVVEGEGVRLAEGRRQLATYTTHWSDLLKDGASWPPLPYRLVSQLYLIQGPTKKDSSRESSPSWLKKSHRKRDVQYSTAEKYRHHKFEHSC